MFITSGGGWIGPGPTELLGFVAGLLISVATSPVGVSGVVFLLPVQVSVLGVPSPAVTLTNLLYNVVAAGDGSVRWVTVGLRCQKDGAVGVYADRKIDYVPTDHL